MAKRRPSTQRGEVVGDGVGDLEAALGEVGGEALDGLVDGGFELDFGIELEGGAGFGGEVVQEAEDEAEAALDLAVELLPEVGVAEFVQVDFGGVGALGGDFQEGADGVDGVAELVADAGGHDAQAQDAVGDEEAVEGEEFFAQEEVPFQLEEEELEGAFEGGFQEGDVPGFGDVFVDGAGVDGVDGGFQVGEGGDEDADDLGAEAAGLFEQLDALFAGHALVGDEDTDFLLMVFEDLVGLGGVGGGEDAEGAFQGAGEVFEGLLLVIDVEDGEAFVVVDRVHAGSAVCGMIAPGGSRIFSGNSKVNSQSWPGRLWTLMRPPTWARRR